MNIKKLTSVRQILNELRTYADRAGNFPTSAAIERLEDYLENESLVDNDVPVKRMVQDVEDFRNSRITLVSPKWG